MNFDSITLKDHSNNTEIVVTVANPKIEYKSDPNTIRCVKIGEGYIFTITQEDFVKVFPLLNTFNMELSTLNCGVGNVEVLVKDKINLNNSVWSNRLVNQG